jgi:hypothetical protein
MWTLESGVAVTQALSPIAFGLGWNLHLGGGVLDHGRSEHDMDVLAMPRWQTQQDKDGLLERLAQLGWLEVRQRTLPHWDVRRLQRKEQVIDLIFVVIG